MKQVANSNERRLTDFTIERTSEQIVWLDCKGRIKRANPAFAASVGYTQQELFQMTAHDINPDFPREIWETHWQEFRQEKRFTMETRHRHKNGAVFPVEITANFINFEGNEYSCIFIRDISERKKEEKKLRDALREVQRLKIQLQAERNYLREEIKSDHNFEEIVYRSEAVRSVMLKVQQVAPTLATVLITGETGTGKELLARAIHNISSRSDKPFIKINCAALPVNLIESELFGHKRGAFTGASESRIGRFKLADRGTLFLDEIGELPIDAQAKFLRVLQEGEFETLGSNKTEKVNVRIIAATNRELATAVAAGKFREDLFYRLNVFPLPNPPLKARKEDIPLLVQHFINKHAPRIGKGKMAISDTGLESLAKYEWPGNIRELENVIERAMIMSPGRLLELGSFANSSPTPPGNESTNKLPVMSLAENEKALIYRTLVDKNWVIEGPNGASRQLDIAFNTLRRKIKKYDLKP